MLPYHLLKARIRQNKETLARHTAACTVLQQQIHELQERMAHHQVAAVTLSQSIALDSATITDYELDSIAPTQRKQLSVTSLFVFPD